MLLWRNIVHLYDNYCVAYLYMSVLFLSVFFYCLFVYRPAGPTHVVNKCLPLTIKTSVFCSRSLWSALLLTLISYGEVWSSFHFGRACVLWLRWQCVWSKRVCHHGYTRTCVTLTTQRLWRLKNTAHSWTDWTRRITTFSLRILLPDIRLQPQYKCWKNVSSLSAGFKPATAVQSEIAV